MKCDICKQNIEITFLDKIQGTYMGKKVVCSSCQRKYKTTKEIKDALNL